MKLWGSVKQQANKLAFDAEKALRVKRQEGAIEGVRTKIQSQYTELGQATLALMEEGVLAHPQLASYANEISRLQDLLKSEAEKLAAIQQEEYDSAEQAIAGGVPPAPPAEPVASSAPPPAEEPAAPPPPPPAE